MSPEERSSVLAFATAVRDAIAGLLRGPQTPTVTKEARVFLLSSAAAGAMAMRVSREEFMSEVGAAWDKADLTRPVAERPS